MLFKKCTFCFSEYFERLREKTRRHIGLDEEDDENNAKDVSSIYRINANNAKDIGLNYQTETYNVKDIGLNIQPDTYNAKDIGLNYQPDAYNAKNIGLKYQPDTYNAKDIGLNYQPDTYNAKDIGLNYQPDTYNAKYIGLNYQPDTYNAKDVSLNYRPDHLTKKSVFKHCQKVAVEKSPDKDINIEKWLETVENMDRIEIPAEHHCEEMSTRLKKDRSKITECKTRKDTKDKDRATRTRFRKNTEKTLKSSPNTQVSKKLKRSHCNVKNDEFIKNRTRRCIKSGKVPELVLDKRSDLKTKYTPHSPEYTPEYTPRYNPRYLANEKVLKQRLVLKKKEKLNPVNSNSSTDEDISLSGSQHHFNQNSSQVNSFKPVKKSRYQLFKFKSSTKIKNKVKGKRKKNKNLIEKTSDTVQTLSNLNCDGKIHADSCKNVIDTPDTLQTWVDLNYDNKTHADSDQNQLLLCEHNLIDSEGNQRWGNYVENLSNHKRTVDVSDECLLLTDLPDVQNDEDINYNMPPKKKEKKRAVSISQYLDTVSIASQTEKTVNHKWALALCPTVGFTCHFGYFLDR